MENKHTQQRTLSNLNNTYKVTKANEQSLNSQAFCFVVFCFVLFVLLFFFLSINKSLELLFITLGTLGHGVNCHKVLSTSKDDTIW